MDQVQAPFVQQAVGGELTWYRSRLALQRERGLPCVDIHRLTCAKDECLPDIPAPAEPADIPPGYICPQLRLYSALGYTDDIIYQCVTPQVCVCARGEAAAPQRRGADSGLPRLLRWDLPA